MTTRNSETPSGPMHRVYVDSQYAVEHHIMVAGGKSRFLCSAIGELKEALELMGDDCQLHREQGGKIYWQSSDAQTAMYMKLRFG